jgi:hypothetical protein
MLTRFACTPLHPVTNRCAFVRVVCWAKNEESRRQTGERGSGRREGGRERDRGRGSQREREREESGRRNGTRSAPEKPGVPRATTDTLTESSTGTVCVCEACVCACIGVCEVCVCVCVCVCVLVCARLCVRESVFDPVPPAIRLRSQTCRCRSRICVRPFTSGLGTTTCRSNRPGRVSALSRTSAHACVCVCVFVFVFVCVCTCSDHQHD